MREPEKAYNEKDWHFEDRQRLYGAIMSRVKLAEVKISHANTEEFPYSTKDLAVYMQHICHLRDEQGEPESVNVETIMEIPLLG